MIRPALTTGLRRSGTAAALAATWLAGGSGAGAEVLAVPHLEISRQDAGVEVLASVSGPVGLGVEAELLVNRFADGSVSRTRQSRSVTLARVPVPVARLTLGGNDLENLEVELIVSRDGQELSQASTRLGSPKSEQPSKE